MTKGRIILNKILDDMLFLIEKNKTFSKENRLRNGQILMNCLPDELYKRISHTEYDCFYDDTKKEKALGYIFGILLTEQEYLEEV